MNIFEDPKDSVMKEIHNTLGELIELGLVEVVGINDQGDWLYGTTQAGKEALKLWEE